PGRGRGAAGLARRPVPGVRLRPAGRPGMDGRGGLRRLAPPEALGVGPLHAAVRRAPAAPAAQRAAVPGEEAAARRGRLAAGRGRRGGGAGDSVLIGQGDAVSTSARPVGAKPARRRRERARRAWVALLTGLVAFAVLEVVTALAMEPVPVRDPEYGGRLA